MVGVEGTTKKGYEFGLFHIRQLSAQRQHRQQYCEYIVKS